LEITKAMTDEKHRETKRLCRQKQETAYNFNFGSPKGRGSHEAAKVTAMR
jgi:hypothetical protein